MKAYDENNVFAKMLKGDIPVAQAGREDAELPGDASGHEESKYNEGTFHTVSEFIHVISVFSCRVSAFPCPEQ